MVQMTQITSGWSPSDRMRLGRIVNVSRPVARYCPNRTSDVMLVQVLLDKACGNSPANGPFQWAHVLRPLRPDGRFGPITASWIQGLQSDPVYGAGLAKDGRVDPASSNVTASNTGTVYTIYLLNIYCNQRDRSFLPNLHRDPAVPAYLRRHLRRAIRDAGLNP